jgi:beta-lactamase regulating signal transducer with metallopeptidase domain
MNLAFATGPFAQAIGWTLLHLLWQGALVAGLLAAALPLLAGRSANLRYALSCAALVLIVALGVATGVRSYAPVTHAPLAPTLSSASVTPAKTSVVAPDPRLEFARVAGRMLPALVTLWILGVALCSLRLLREWLGARRLVARGVPAPAAFQDVARRLGDALGVRTIVRLLESSAVTVPSVIGFVRPAILLPASSLTGLTPAQLEMILAHELAHIRRHDFLVNLLQAVVETLLFYHPAVWWISRRVRAERENCCDDLAVAVCGNPLQYARALTRLEELRAEGLALAMSADGGSLLERVRRIAGGASPSRGPGLRGTAALSAFVVLALASIALPALGRRGAEPAHAVKAVQAIAAPAPHEVISAIAGVPVPAEPQATATVAADGPEDEVVVQEVVQEVVEERKPTLDQLIALRVHNVTPERIEEMRRIFPGVSLDEIASMSAVGATPEFIRGLRREGLEIREPDDATGLAAVGVTSEYLKEIRAVGMPVQDASDIQGMAAVGVSARFIRELRAAGIAVETAKQAQSLAAVGVTAEYVRALRHAGVRIGETSEVQNLSALGITPEFVERLTRAGYTNLTVEQLSRLGAAGMTGGFIEQMSKYRTRPRERKPS